MRVVVIDSVVGKGLDPFRNPARWNGSKAVPYEEHSHHKKRTAQGRSLRESFTSQKAERRKAVPYEDRSRHKKRNGARPFPTRIIHITKSRTAQGCSLQGAFTSQKADGARPFPTRIVHVTKSGTAQGRSLRGAFTSQKAERREDIHLGLIVFVGKGLDPFRIDPFLHMVKRNGTRPFPTSRIVRLDQQCQMFDRSHAATIYAHRH